MAKPDAIKAKIAKLAAKNKLDGIIKFSSDSDAEIRAEAARGMGMIKTYESGMALIPLLRDSSPLVRATAATSVADINAKHCEEYVKKLAFADADPEVRAIAKEAFDRLKTSVV